MSRALQILVFAGVIGAAVQLLFYQEPVGLNLVVAIALFLALAWTARRARVRLADALDTDVRRGVRSVRCRAYRPGRRRL